MGFVGSKHDVSGNSRIPNIVKMLKVPKLWHFTGIMNLDSPSGGLWKSVIGLHERAGNYDEQRLSFSYGPSALREILPSWSR
jgi:hypothetical protein